MFRKGLIFFAVLLAVAFVAAVYFFRMTDTPVNEKIVAQTAKSGFLRVGAEHALAGTARTIVPVFSRYYPDAFVALDTAHFADLFNSFLEKKLGAVLLSGALGRGEMSLLESNQIAYRLEPVARGAVICIVNSDNPLQFLCVEDLADIYTARRTRWGDGSEIKAYLNNRDLRLQQQFLAMTAPDESHLTAWHAGSDEELMRLVSRETGAIGILPLSRAIGLIGKDQASLPVRVLPLCRESGDAPVMPSQHTVYYEKYPLGYIIYYLYHKDKSLATGFGAWLANEGQKGFTRSALAPYKRPVRVINLQ